MILPPSVSRPFFALLGAALAMLICAVVLVVGASLMLVVAMVGLLAWVFTLPMRAWVSVHG